MRKLLYVPLVLILTTAACSANLAASISDQPAAVVCGGLKAAACPERQFCDMPAGQCKAADLQGTCMDKPDACTKEYHPVCGCDGQTYGNDCMRRSAGAQKDHDGACPKG